MLNGKKILFISVCIIVLTACIICSGCTTTDTQTTVKSDSPAATTTSQDAIAATSPETPVTTLTQAVITPSTVATTPTLAESKVIVTLNSATKKASLGTYKPKTGNIFLVVDMTIKNTDTENDFDYSASSFTLYDKGNQKTYSPITSQVSGSLTNPFTSGTVPFKSEVTGQIVFGVVNTGTDAYKLAVTDSDGTEIASFTKFVTS